MTKRKYSRLKHQKDASFADTSEEELNTANVQEKGCPHVNKAIHFGRVKKSLKSSQSILTCNGCSSENSGEELPEVWLCLQCGYRGCSRISENKHGLQHFKTLHSDCHSLVLSTTSGIVWCYDCDDEISLNVSRVLKQCVEFVMKMAVSGGDKSVVSNVGRSAPQNLQETVIKEEISVQNTEENIQVDKNKKSVKNDKEISLVKNKEISQKIPIKGLRNLGNTCFFNAVMQNLNQTSLLHFELKNTCTPSQLWEVPELVFTDNEILENENANSFKLSLPRQFPLTNSLLNFLEQMSSTSSSKIDIINPSPLFGEISRKCPQFRHFQQQDSHELLRQLLDGVRQEEIKRQKKAILRHFGLENVSPENVEEDMKKQIKAYGSYASHTIVEKIFGGLLISTVLCEECKASSQVFEPFMDLSLPLFEEKHQESNEQLYGMLDGGKQANSKPLRNKKVGWDSDENTEGEYVLSKPKNDSGKPSKHQEKKQKQLAKKEKKRAKNNARNRNNSLNEQSNQPIDVKEDTDNKSNEDKVNDDDDAEEDEENEQDEVEEEEKSENAEEIASIDHEGEEVWEVGDLFASDEENSLEDATVTPLYNSIYAQDSMKANDENAQTDHEELQTDKVENLVQSIEDEGTTNLSQSASNTIYNAYDVEKADESMEVEALSNASVPTDENFEMGECFENQNKELKELVTESNQKENTCAENEDKETINTCDAMKNHSDSLENLLENFASHLKLSDSNQSNIDDRIQALSMQVKDVRIRRDSDRQENLLSSPESTDECGSQKTICTSPKSSVEDSCSVDNGDNWSHSISEQQTKDWISKTLTTIKPRHHVSPLECSINSCISHFTKPELLTGSNKFRCENCTELKIKKTGNKKDVVYSNASKQMLIFSPPAVLTLHLKRFQQVGMSLKKVNRFVEFPLVLDIAPFCCSASLILPHMSSTEDEILYSLYGVVEHSGRLTSGHYTAYVKANKRTINRTFECQLPLAQCDLEQLLRKFSGAKSPPNSSAEQVKESNSQWFYISDSHVKEVTETQVLKCQAYLLFYERIK